MWWLWIAGPVLAALVFLLTDWPDKRRDAELERWRARMREGKRGELKRVGALPGSLGRLVVAAGGGKRIEYYELVPKIAYLAAMGGDSACGSDHHTIVAKLDEAGPTLTARPLPILDGQREPNAGVQFKKDAEFMETFLVERALEGSEKPAAAAADEAADKAIRKWLSPVVREALMDMPDAWLRVEGKTMAVTLYGPADVERLNELVTLADTIFAEYGADGGPSLFGDDDEEEPAAAPPPKKKAAKKPAADKSV